MFKTYFEDELEFLRAMGTEFGAAYPDIASELGIEGRDPDVERLLEGVAFLTARIRQNLDDDYLELLNPLLEMTWPHAMRPTPAICIVEFKPQPGRLRESLLIEKGARLDSKPVDGTVCRFQTCYALEVTPLELTRLRYTTPASDRAELNVDLRLLPGSSPRKLGQRPLRFCIRGTPRQKFGLYESLLRGLRGIRVEVRSESDELLETRELPKTCLRPVGFEDAEALLPYPARAFTGYRPLHEYFLFPDKYLFVEVGGLEWLRTHEELVSLEMAFLLEPRADAPSLTEANLHLHCVPAINLYPHPARPIRADNSRTEYALEPEGAKRHHYDVFSLETVSAFDRRRKRSIQYLPFHDHDPASSRRDALPVFQLRRRTRAAGVPAAGVPAAGVPGAGVPGAGVPGAGVPGAGVPGAGVPGGAGQVVASQAGISTGDHGASSYPEVDAFLALVQLEGSEPTAPTVLSADLLVTNRDLPSRLKPGDLCVPTTDVPALVTFANIDAKSAAASAPVGQEGLWRFLSLHSLGWSALSDLVAFRRLLGMFAAPARVDQREGKKLDRLQKSLKKLEALPERRALGQPPAVVHGTHVRLELHESAFSHTGELYLFGSVLSRYIQEMSPLNTFTRLSIRGVDRGLELGWAPMIGRQGLV